MRKKKGITRRGNTITFYGEDANALMAMLEASNCDSQRKAWSLLRDREPGQPYPDRLAQELQKHNWRIPKRFQRSTNETKNNT